MTMIEFEATRCLDGYRIRAARRRVYGRSPSRLQMVALPQFTVPGAPDAYIAADSERFERFDPTRISGLFRIFADAPSSAEGMCNFAARFGLPSDSEGGGDVVAADIGPLLAHQAALRAALGLLDARDAVGFVQRFNTYWGRIRVKLLPRAERGVETRLVPLNFVQFLWVQLALHAASEAKLLRCQRCGEPFRVGTGTGRRETAKFCSNACKVAAFRRRHKGRKANA